MFSEKKKKRVGRFAMFIIRHTNNVTFFTSWEECRACIYDGSLYHAAIMRFATPGVFLHHGSAIIPSSLACPDPPWKPSILSLSLSLSLPLSLSPSLPLSLSPLSLSLFPPSSLLTLSHSFSLCFFLSFSFDLLCLPYSRFVYHL